MGKIERKGANLAGLKQARTLAEQSLKNSQKFLDDFAWIKKNEPKAKDERSKARDAIVKSQIEQKAEKMNKIIPHW